MTRTKVLAFVSLCAAAALSAAYYFARPPAAPGVNAARQVAAQPLLPSSQATPEPAAEPFPTPVIELSGSAAEMGAAHGKHFGRQIRELQTKYLESYFQDDSARFLAMTAAAAFEHRLLPEHMAEVKALAEHSGVDWKQMLLGQCFLDLSPMTACSTITLPPEACADGVGRFGRNLDFPGFNIADNQSVVFVCRPEGKYQFAAVSWPSLVGVLSGMNEHGLTLANMEVTRGMRLPAAMPYTLLYRTILERCRTVDEAVELLEKTPRQTANNLMLMDAAGARAVAEVTPAKVTVRRTPADSPQAALISTNHQRGPDDCDTAGRCRRFDCLHDLAAEQFGRVDVPAVQKMLARSAQAKFTLQSMVFEPSTRVLYLSTGPGAAAGTFHRLDLKPYFAKTITPGAPAATP
jgi:predicted choloylglycine hydrolase